MNEITLPRDYFMEIRRALLMQLDAIERILDITPRTAELRKEAKKDTIPEQKPENVVQ